MKRFLFWLLPLLVIQGCYEEPLRVNLIGGESAQRKVLIEKFTGVRCVNCPLGADEIENLQGIYGENIVPVSVHAGFFAQKYPDSKFDFKTQLGQELEDWLGRPNGYPSAVINRKRFTGEESIQVQRQSWSAYVTSEIQRKAKARLTLVSEYDLSTRLLSVNVFLVAEESIASPVRLTVLLTESNIIDPQLTPSGKVEAYKHKDVLRTMLTNYEGNTVASSMTQGEVIQRTYNFTLPQDGLDWWVPENIKVVVFATESASQGPGEVLNAEFQSIIPE
jgi:hypothetical protein